MNRMIKLKQKYVIMYTLLILVTIILLSYIILKSIAFKGNNNTNNTNVNSIVSNNGTNIVENNTVDNKVTENNTTNDKPNNTTSVDNKVPENNTTDDKPNKTTPAEKPNLTINTSYVQDEYSIENITLEETKIIFNEKHAMAVGDSMAEGLDCYGVLNKENVVWHRGRRIDTMSADLEKVKAYNPNYLFLAYGANDIKSWTSNVDGWIAKYREAIMRIQSELPNTKIIVNSVLPVSDYATANDPSFTYQPMYNDALKNLAKELGIQFLENGVYLADRVNSFSPDGVHPKVPFFQNWGKHMASYLKSVN